MQSYYYLLMLIVLCFGPGSIDAENSKISCKDEQGENVDWFYIYKLPKNFETKNPLIDKSGLRYYYVTSKDYSSWKFSQYKIDEGASMPGRTLSKVLNDQLALLITYNDQPPNGTATMSRGHSKGVVTADKNDGVWLIHSVPMFPIVPSYEYPNSGALYGQSFLCLSLTAKEIDKVGNLLIYNEINVYHSNLPDELKGKFPTLEEAMKTKRFKTGPHSIIIDLETSGGKRFRGFAKNKKFGGDLYEDLVAPTLDSNLLVETWRNGGGNLASNCSAKDKVYNVAEISSQEWELSFKSTRDHSKWAVSEETGLKLWKWRIGGSDWICIGDINRQNHQKERGGGTVCQKSSRVAKLYRKLIGDFDSCEKPRASQQETQSSSVPI